MPRKSVIVGGGSNVTFGLLKDLYVQLEIGERTSGKKGLTGDQLRAFVEHRNPFDLAQISAVLPYADEVVESNIDYPEGFQIRSVAEQVERLTKEFPNLDFSHAEELASGKLPEGAEGWGVIPKQSKIAENYHGAFDKAIALLAEQHGEKFENWREGALTEKHLRLIEKTEKKLAKLEKETPGDCLVIPFQFGKKWRGKSVRHAQIRFDDNEFGLGPYEVAILLLTHPGRIIGSGQLYIDCGGCEYNPNETGDSFPFCLLFRWRSDYKRLELSCGSTDYTLEQWGCASGFAS